MTGGTPAKGGFGLAVAGVVVLVVGTLLDIFFAIGLNQFRADELTTANGVVFLLMFIFLPAIGLGLCHAARQRDMASGKGATGLSNGGVVAGWVLLSLALLFGLFVLWFSSGGVGRMSKSGMDGIFEEMDKMEQEEKAKKGKR